VLEPAGDPGLAVLPGSGNVAPGPECDKRSRARPGVGAGPGARVAHRPRRPV